MNSTGFSRLAVLGTGVAIVAALPLLFEVLLSGDLSQASIATSLASLAIAVGGGVWISYRTETALRHIEGATIRFAGGSFDELVELPPRRRLQALTEGLNEMAIQLQGRVTALSQLSREQDAILRSMTEGVVTVDSEGKVRRVNEAARQLLGISKAYVEGRAIAEIINHPEIQRFMEEASASMVPKTGTVMLRQDPETILDVYGSPLFQDDGSSSGTLIVLRDMTRVHKLENVRRDFVANVSHELRTPITSIKGFTETLLEGAMHEPESLRKFLEIISKHAERLHAIFNDLLTLARLEAGSGDDQIQVSTQKLSEIVREAIEACSSNALAKTISLSSSVTDDIRVAVNPNLMQQAFVNLIDNAIKYSDSGASVSVSADREGEYVRCMVTDTGPGIEGSHLPRLFERFYRVDQGRSRQMGGTGLGLAIVKHIAQVHGGRVEVQSELGQGSIFSILLKPRS
jgi:two-component system phosphate regulon sensor histidine kinase PhoR